MTQPFSTTVEKLNEFSRTSEQIAVEDAVRELDEAINELVHAAKSRKTTPREASDLGTQARDALSRVVNGQAAIERIDDEARRAS